MDGALSFACLNKSRTLEAPTPTNISTKSEPEREKKELEPLQQQPLLTMFFLYLEGLQEVLLWVFYLLNWCIFWVF